MNKDLKPTEICHLILDIGEALDLLIQQKGLTKENAEHVIRAYCELNAVFASQERKIK